MIFFYIHFLSYSKKKVFAHGETFGHAAMTTVLARPLGGYGLTPLVFEPSPITTSLMQGSSSNSVATKVRKSPVYELIMPTFDEELPITGAASEQSSSQAKILKKMTYDTLIPSQQQQKQSTINSLDNVSINHSPANSTHSSQDSGNKLKIIDDDDDHKQQQSIMVKNEISNSNSNDNDVKCYDTIKLQLKINGWSS